MYNESGCHLAFSNTHWGQQPPLFSPWGWVPAPQGQRGCTTEGGQHCSLTASVSCHRTGAGCWAGLGEPSELLDCSPAHGVVTESMLNPTALAFLQHPPPVTSQSWPFIFPALAELQHNWLPIAYRSSCINQRSEGELGWQKWSRDGGHQPSVRKTPALLLFPVEP